MESAMERATPKHQAPSTKHRPLVTSGRQAQSVPREPRSGPGWAWWREVNPIDGETMAQPWSNLGLVDLDHTEQKRTTYATDRHKCSTCQVTWCGPEPCWSCDSDPDDQWGTSSRDNIVPGVDSGVRRMR